MKAKVRANLVKVLVAVSASLIVSAAYQCLMEGPRETYWICRAISFGGIPGLFAAAYLAIPLHGGSHGGGPEFLFLATAVNCLVYLLLVFGVASLR